MNIKDEKKKTNFFLYPKRRMLWEKEKMNNTSKVSKKQDHKKSISIHKSNEELQSN